MTALIWLSAVALALANLFVNGCWGIPTAFLVLWLTWDIVQSNASRRANIDRYYLFQCRLFGIFLHHLKKDEKPGVYHTHPWSWFSIVFGSYWDFRLDGRWRLVRFFNRCRAGEAHRLELNRGKVWTLCFRGPRREQWRVLDEHGNVIETQPWTGTEKPQRMEYV